MFLNPGSVMRPSSSRLLFTAFIVAACGAPATVATTPAPTRAPASATPAPASVPSAATPLTAPAVTLAEPPRDWQLLDESTDHIPGIGVERAMHELLAGKAPQRTVLVAIIDNGIDTSQVDLRANLWTNPKETQGSGKNGDDVHFDTFEVTRQYAACHGKAAAGGQPAITDAERCKQIDADYEKQRDQINKEVATYREIDNVLKQIVPLLQMAAKTDSLTPDRVRALPTTSPQIAQARQIYLELAAEGASPSVIEDGLKSLEGQAKYSLDPSFDSRTTVGDNYADPNERHYGNADVMGQDPKHGTHVAGIIGAVQHNGIGVDGIAPAVKLMMLRVVPDGDERDKDIGNAIRYAVDNGAQII